MTRVHSHLHVYTAIPQIIIQNVIIRAVKYGSNQRTRSNVLDFRTSILSCKFMLDSFWRDARPQFVSFRGVYTSLASPICAIPRES